MIKTDKHCKRKRCVHLAGKLRTYCRAHKLSMKEVMEDCYAKIIIKQFNEAPRLFKTEDKKSKLLE